MRTRNALLLSFFLLIPWALPATTLAGPPDVADDGQCPGDLDGCIKQLEKLEALPTPQIHEQWIKGFAEDIERLKQTNPKPDLETAKKITRLETGLARLESRESALHFLSVKEVERLAIVEPFEVMVDPIENNPTGKHLAQACASLPALPRVSNRLHGASLRGEVEDKQPALADAINQLRSPTQADTATTQNQAVEVATMLAIVGQDIDSLCKRIAASTLEDGDIELLRSIYGEDAKTVLRYQELLTKTVDGISVAQLVDRLISSTTDDDVKRLVKALAVDPTGASRALPTSANLGAAATMVFEGLGEFLIDRAKEETLNYIRDTLVERICGSDLQVFIPKTCGVMSDLDPSMALSAMGKLLHAAVIADLEIMPDRLLVLAWMRSDKVAYPATVVRVALPMLEQAKLHVNPLEYAASIHSMPETDCENQPGAAGSGDRHCAETLVYLRVASTLLRASVGNVDNSYTERELPFLVLGVAFDFERYFTKIPKGARERTKAKLASVSGLQWSNDANPSFANEGLKTLTNWIAKSIALAADLEETVKLVAQTNPLTGESTATPTRILATARTTVVGLAELAQIAAAFDSSSSNDALRKILADSSKLVAMSDAIRSEDWGSAALATFDVVAKIVDDQTDTTANEMAARVFDEIRKYLPLFVEVANAKSSADVKAALEAAFPAGGYRLKYRQPAVALNAYLGLYAGGTYLFDDSSQLTHEVAMFAPIGVEIGGPIRHTTRRAWRLGLLVSAVDLGAITTSKFLATEVAQTPQADGEVTTNEEPAKFNIAGLLSPGLYFTVGIAESPFGLGVGASVNPFALQQVSRNYIGGEVDSQSQHYLTALRFGAFLAVDITMVAFGMKGRHKR